METSTFNNEEGILVNLERVVSISDYLDYIEEIKDKWNTDLIWYRGVPKSSFSLVPSIYRNNVWKYNQKDARIFYNEFRRRATPFINYNQKSMWELYQLMQHYGAPTRLLDWTEGSLIGLFFALIEKDKRDYPCVWCMDPHQLNKINTNKSVIFYTPKFSSSSKSTVNKYLKDNPELPKNPIALSPHFSDKRIISQKSCFTIHGKNKKGIEEQIKKNPEARIAKIVIDNEFIERIEKEITSTGITFSVMFPDLEGLAKELKSEFGMR